MLFCQRALELQTIRFFASGGFERLEEGDVTIPNIEDPNLILYQPQMGLLPGTNMQYSTQICLLFTLD
jgi:hypothetical protein